MFNPKHCTSFQFQDQFFIPNQMFPRSKLVKVHKKFLKQKFHFTVFLKLIQFKQIKKGHTNTLTHTQRSLSHPL